MNRTPATMPTPPFHPAFTVFHLELNGKPFEVTLIHADDLPRTLLQQDDPARLDVPGRPVTLDSPVGVWLRGCQVGSEERLILQPKLGTPTWVKVTAINPATEAVKTDAVNAA